MRALLGAVLAGAVVAEAGAPQGAADARAIESLRAFARLYGYVRFFHPSDAAAEADWERLAILGVGRARRATTPEELREVLMGLFGPLASGLEVSTSPLAEREVPPEPNGVEVVAWQHRGVGLGGAGETYVSARTGRVTRVAKRRPGPGFGNAMQSIPAGLLRGLEIRLEAKVKAAVSGRGNQGQLWIRVDRASKAVGFFDNMGDRPITADRWATYAILGKVDGDAERVAFGCFLAGDGKLWVDGVRLSVRPAGGEWQPVEVRNPSFEQAGAGLPDGWMTPTPGYAFRVVEDQASDGKRSLLISRDAEVEVVDEPLFPERPRLGEATTRLLGGGVWCRVPLALTDEEAARTLSPENVRLQALQRDLVGVDLPALTGADEALRLGDVVIVWNVLQHFYPYFDVVGADWESQLVRALRQALVDRTPEDFLGTLERMVAALKDGHGRVSLRGRQPWGWAPFALEEAEGQIVVTAVGPGVALQVGDSVKSLEGVPVGEVLAGLQARYSGSPQWTRLRAVDDLTRGPAGSVIELGIDREGSSFALELTRSARAPFAKPRDQAIRPLAEGVLYVDLTSASLKDVDAVMERLVAARAVVFDLRGYPKANHEVLCHLARTPIRSARWNIPQVIRPDRRRFESWDTSGRWELPDREPRIPGKAFFLTDARAISYAESVLGIVEFYRLGEIVGRPTAGANGNVNVLDLPGGLTVSWTGMKVLKHDGSQHHLVGIQPTIPVARTVRAIRDGRDEDVEAALRAFHTAGK